MTAKTKKKLLMITYGGVNHASSRIRAMNYIKFLEESGDWEVKLIPRAPDRKRGVFQKLLFAILKRMYLLHRLINLLFVNWEVVFVQRVFLTRLELCVINKKKCRLIYDFDDAIYLNNNGRKAGLMVSKASHLIVATNELVPFCKLYSDKIPNVIVSPVDTHQIFPGKFDGDKKHIVIGWIGSIWTEKYLELVKKAIEGLKEHPVSVLLVGSSGNFIFDQIKVENRVWHLDQEPAYLQQMDIGIMPLSDDEWSRGKGGYKLYQYMAAGIPVVASPVGINKKIVEHGLNGYLAENKEQWIHHLKSLIEDADLRKKLGSKGRIDAETRYSYLHNFPLLRDVLNKN